MKRFIVTFMASLLITVPAVAQEITEEPTPAPTVEVTPEVTEEAPDVVVINESDLEPIIDEYAGDLREALKFASPVLALFVFLTSAALKYVFPNTVITTEQIVGGVTSIAALVYGLAELFDAAPALMNGVSVLNELAGPALQIAIILFLPSGLYYLARKWNTPVLSAKQGNEAFSLEPRTGANAAG